MPRHVFIEDPGINSPFEEPREHFRFGDDGITTEIVGEPSNELKRALRADGETSGGAAMIGHQPCGVVHWGTEP